MEIEKVEEVIYEARRFIKKAVKVLRRNNKEKYAICCSKETAACRRSSMDLTRSLAELRK